jgi:hypothetical protein
MKFEKSLRPFRYSITSSITEVPRGVLRPVLSKTQSESNADRQNAGLRLLLYAEEVVLDESDFFIPYFDPAMFAHPADFEIALKQLRRIRPFCRRWQH